METLNQKQKLVAIIAIVVVVGVIGYYYINSTKDVYSSGYEAISSSEEEENTQKEEEPKEPQTILIHIAGEVKIQGIVEVEENARIYDVIEEAGGTTERADLRKVNLAYKVSDGQKIYIPSITQTSQNDIEIISDSAGENIIEIDETQNSKNNNGRVNINTATVDLLSTLPGIGISTAQKIITYRETNGKFKTIEELKNVSGVGTAKFEAIKELIYV